MENKEVFRKSNLERISSPEKMNDYIKVINPSVVIMLAALGLLLLGGLAWGLMETSPLRKIYRGRFMPVRNKAAVTKWPQWYL